MNDRLPLGLFGGWFIIIVEVCVLLGVGGAVEKKNVRSVRRGEQRSAPPA